MRRYLAEPEHPLARARKLVGSTQAELAERVGVHRVTLARLEGGAEPGVALALRIAVAVGRGVSELWPLPAEGEQGAEVIDFICPACGGTGRIEVERRALGLRARRRRVGGHQ